MKSSQLTYMYAVLHALCVSNWIPILNKQTVTVPTGRLLYVTGQKKKINIGK